MTPLIRAGDGSITIQLYTDNNCTTPLNNTLFDLHSFTHPTDDWYCDNQLSSAVVSPHWSQLNAFCIADAGTANNYVSLAVMYYENVIDCNRDAAMYLNYSYELSWSSPQPATPSAVMGLCTNGVFLDHHIGTGYGQLVSAVFNCTFASGSSSYHHSPAARYTVVAVAAISMLFGVAVASWIAE